jgi:hypothetical protein
MRNRCIKCNRTLAQPKDKGASHKDGGASPATAISPTEVARTYKNDYSHASNEQTDRSIECIQELCERMITQKVGSKEICESALKLIFRQFHIKEVSVALRSASDGRYRYVAMQGMRANVWEVHCGLSYTKDGLFDSKKYKSTQVSKYTRLFLAEDEPYDSAEKKTYSEHLMLGSVRRAHDDSIEGDYLDILIFGPGDFILGFIEISGTWDGKLPTPRAIKTLEIVANLVGIVVSRDPSIAGTENPGADEPPKKK